MNPVRSYRDFQEFMSIWGYNGKPIPVLLIKPDVLLALKEHYDIDDLFDYFNHRAGKDIVFFLPGYEHNPSNSLSTILLDYGRRDDQKIALTYQDFHTRQPRYVYYNNRDFVDFIDTIERGTPKFRYYGDTELLLPLFVPGANNKFGNLDFSTLSDHRYNLSEFYYRHADGRDAIRAVNRFLEIVLHRLNAFRSLDQFYSAVDNAYTH